MSSTLKWVRMPVAGMASGQCELRVCEALECAGARQVHVIWQRGESWFGLLRAVDRAALRAPSPPPGTRRARSSARPPGQGAPRFRPNHRITHPPHHELQSSTDAQGGAPGYAGARRGIRVTPAPRCAGDRRALGAGQAMRLPEERARRPRLTLGRFVVTSVRAGSVPIGLAGGAEAAATRADTLGIVVHGHPIVGDYVTGSGGGTLARPPTGTTGLA